MSVPQEYHNLLMYLLQVGFLIAFGALLRLVFRLRLPRVLLIYWQVLLIVSLLVPLAAPRKIHMEPDASEPALVQSAGRAAPSIPQTDRRSSEVAWAAHFWRNLFPAVAVISLVRLGMLALGLIRLRNLRARARRLELPAHGFECIEPIRGDSVFFISADIPGPATYGWMRSTILLPRQFEDMDAESQLSILSHELIHVRRHDWLLGFFEQLIGAFFWFHPAVLWLIRRIELAREQLVDRRVLDLSIDRRQYLKSLLFTAGGPEALRSANLFLARRHLKARIALLLEEIHMSRKRLAVSLASAAVLFVVGAAISTQVFPLTQSAISGPQPPAPPASQAKAAVLPRPVDVSPGPAADEKPSQDAPPASQAKVVPIAPRTVAEPAATVSTQKSIAGVVVDPDESPLPGVDIRVTDPETNEVLATGVTDERGGFNLTLPSPKANVDCAFSEAGFNPIVIKNVQAGNNAPTSLRVKMQLAGAKLMFIITPGAKRTGAFVSPIDIAARAMPAQIRWEANLSYPAEAVRQAAEAEVILEVRVDTDGAISDMRLLKGDPLFDEAVMNAVRQWRGQPASLNGKPHVSINTITCRFRLK